MARAAIFAPQPMAFLHPGFLWALFALAIPVLIHLFQLRRFKRIEFPNVRYLKEVSQRTRQQKKVRHWLVLIARCLALAALVLAFAQPYLPGNAAKATAGQRAVSVYIDDSYSMDGQNAQGRLLDQARAGAQQAIMAYNATDRFQVITGALEGRQQLLVGRDEALEAASRVDGSAFSRPLSQVLPRQREALSRSEARSKRAILFTDLQRSTTDVDRWTNDSTVRTVIVPILPTTPDNLSIDSAWFDSPVRRLGQAEVLHVRIRNRGGRDLENVPLRLTIDGQERALATFGATAGAVADTVLRFTNDRPGPHRAEVSITDQPVTFDDRLHLAYRTAEGLRVLLVSGDDGESDGRITAVFEGDSAHAIGVQPFRSLDLGALTRADLAILNAVPNLPSGSVHALKEMVRAGGSLAVFPGTDSDLSGYNALLAELGAGSLGRRDTSAIKVDRIDLQQPFFREVFSTMPRNVDLPQVRTRFALRMPPGSDVLLRLQDGSAFLAAARSGKGTVYVCASPLGGGAEGFTRHALFVTSLLRMAELSRPMGALYHTIGDGTAIPMEADPPAGDAAVHLKGPGGLDVVPEIRRSIGGNALVLHDLDLPEGAYAVVQGSDTLQRIALDLARSESDLSCYTPEELRVLLVQRGLTAFEVLDGATEDLSISLKRLDEGRKLWMWFIGTALLLLIAETALIRWRT